MSAEDGFRHVMQGNLSPNQKSTIIENKQNPYFEAILQSFVSTQDVNDLEENIRIFVTVQNVIRPVFQTIEELIDACQFSKMEKSLLISLIERQETTVKAVWMAYEENKDFEEAEETLRILLTILPEKKDENGDNQFSEDASHEWVGEENGESESDAAYQQYDETDN